MVWEVPGSAKRSPSACLTARMSVLCGCMAAAAAHAQPASEPAPAGPPQPPSQAAPESAPAAAPPVEPAATAQDPLPGQVPNDPFPPTGANEELDEIRPGVALKRAFDKLAAETNLRFGLAHTMLFQQASGGPGARTAAGGDLDILGKWTAIGAGAKDTGILVGSVEYRYQMGDLTPSALGGQIGTLLPTTNGFGERPFVVKEFYWDQRLFDDRFRYAVGRIDPENLFGGHRLQSANTFFLNKAFSSNPTVAFPGPGMAGAMQIKPVDWSYLTVGLTDANGSATTAGFTTFFQDTEFLTFAEAGVTPKIEGVGSGRYRLAVWHIDERENANRPSDRGFTVSFDQDLGSTFIAFARYGHADGDVTSISNSVQGGVGIKDVLGKDNMLGFAAAWSRPADSGKRDEKVVEIFQRFQCTETIQFTIGVETIFDPSNAPGDDLLGVFSARLRFSF